MYEYAKEKPTLFTDKGSRDFTRNRDLVLSRLKENGAVRSGEAMRGFEGHDSFFYLACLDRMIEIGDMQEVTGTNVAGQDRVFVSAIPNLQR